MRSRATGSFDSPVVVHRSNPSFGSNPFIQQNRLRKKRFKLGDIKSNKPDNVHMTRSRAQTYTRPPAKPLPPLKVLTDGAPITEPLDRKLPKVEVRIARQSFSRFSLKAASPVIVSPEELFEADTEGALELEQFPTPESDPTNVMFGDLRSEFRKGLKNDRMKDAIKKLSINSRAPKIKKEDTDSSASGPASGVNTPLSRILNLSMAAKHNRNATGKVSLPEIALLKPESPHLIELTVSERTALAFKLDKKLESMRGDAVIEESVKYMKSKLPHKAVSVLNQFGHFCSDRNFTDLILFICTNEEEAKDCLLIVWKWIAENHPKHRENMYDWSNYSNQDFLCRSVYPDIPDDVTTCSRAQSVDFDPVTDEQLIHIFKFFYPKPEDDRYAAEFRDNIRTVFQFGVGRDLILQHFLLSQHFSAYQSVSIILQLGNQSNPVFGRQESNPISVVSHHTQQTHQSHHSHQTHQSHPLPPMVSPRLVSPRNINHLQLVNHVSPNHHLVSPKHHFSASQPIHTSPLHLTSPQHHMHTFSAMGGEMPPSVGLGSFAFNTSPRVIVDHSPSTESETPSPTTITNAHSNTSYTVTTTATTSEYGGTPYGTPVRGFSESPPPPPPPRPNHRGSRIRTFSRRNPLSPRQRFDDV